MYLLLVNKIQNLKERVAELEAENKELTKENTRLAEMVDELVEWEGKYWDEVMTRGWDD